MLKLLLFIGLLIISATTLDFSSKVNKTTGKTGVTNIEFSDDQTFLVTLNKNGNEIKIYNGFNLN